MKQTRFYSVLLIILIIGALSSCNSNQITIKSESEIEADISERESILAVNEHISSMFEDTNDLSEQDDGSQEIANEFSLEEISWRLSQEDFGYSRYDYLYLSLDYVYHNKEINEKYGPGFSVSDMIFEDKQSRGFLRFYTAQADCLIRIADDWYYVKTQKNFSEKWQVIFCHQSGNG